MSDLKKKQQLCVASCTEKLSSHCNQVSLLGVTTNCCGTKHKCVFVLLASFCHPFKAIPSAVCERLSKLTTMTETDKHLLLDKIHPQCFQALLHTNPVTKMIPALTEQPQDDKEAAALKQVKDNSNNKENRRRTICCCIGYFDLRSQPVHSIIETTKDKFNLQ